MSAVANPAQALHKPTQAKSKYRPEIDGLRAFAVVAVIINHFNKDLLPSGYLGVDIFFVISGYVITSSLADRKSKNFLDFLTGFYERRIKRLVPALVVFVLITSVLISLFNPEPGVALGLGWRSLFGISNINLYQGSTDYFAQSTELNPFTHTWSLGVEEQFYLLFPFLIWFSGFGQQTAKGARNLFFWVGALTIASLIGFIYLYQVNQPAAYFLMPPRFWEMAAGCLIFIGFQKRARIEQALEQVPPLLVVAAMVGVMYLPVAAAVPATIGIVVLSAVLIACLKKGTAAYQFFTLEKIVYVGLISYSLYLWHWTVLCISRWTIGIHWWSVPFQVGLMMLMAMGSYRWVETHFRRTNWSSIRWKTIGWGVGTSFAASGVILGMGRQLDDSIYLGGEKRIENLDEISQAAEGTTLSSKNCSEYKNDTIAKCSIKPKTTSTQRLLLIGDSHTSHYFPLLGWLHNQTGIGITGFVTSGQPFPPARYTHNQGRTREKWEKSDSDIQKFFEKQFDLLQRGDILALSSRLEYYFIRSKFNLEHKDVTLRLADGDWNTIEEDKALSAWLNEIRTIAKKSEEKGISVVLFAPIPVFRGNPKGAQPPEQLCVKEWFRPRIPKECLGLFRQERSTLESRLEKINKELDALAATKNNIQIYKPFDLLCSKRSNYCETYLSGIRTFRDDDHLSRDGSLLVATDFLEFASKTGLIRRQTQ
jgi:peptidoglycan/LPS O-acetylase OafA/YrhL